MLTVNYIINTNSSLFNVLLKTTRISQKHSHLYQKFNHGWSTWKEKVTVSQSKGSGGKCLHVYKTGYLGRICSKASEFIHSLSKKPSRICCHTCQVGQWTFTNTRRKHKDKGDEHRKLLASSLCVKGGTATQTCNLLPVVLKKTFVQTPLSKLH